MRPPHVNHSWSQFTLSWETSSLDLLETKRQQGKEAQQPLLWMGLGQVRDLRRSSVRAIVEARRDHPFTSASDLLSRVPLARKEWTHLIQTSRESEATQ